MIPDLKKILYFLFIPLLLGFSSCQKDSFYHQFQPAASWAHNQTLRFEDSICPLAEKTDLMELKVFVRNNNTYPYTKLSLYVDIYLADTSYHDSIDFELCNERGKWTGSGWGSLFTQHKHLRVLPVEPAFRIDIRHAMQDELLVGIQDIGISLTAP